MNYVITIQKNYLRFFYISLIVSAILVFAINIIKIDKEENQLTKKCNSYIDVIYNYNKVFNNKLNKSLTFDFLKYNYKNEILKLFENKKDVQVNSKTIHFKHPNCKKHIDLVLSKKSEIQKNLYNDLFNLNEYVINNGAKLPFPDDLMLFSTTEDNIIDFKISYNVNQNMKKISSTIIQFTILVIILNFIFYLRQKIKFNLK